MLARDCLSQFEYDGHWLLFGCISRQPWLGERAL